MVTYRSGYSEMEYNNWIDKKLEYKLNKFVREYLLREKDEDEREVIEEVFDKSTLLHLYHLVNKGVIYEVRGIISSGKEARVYAGIDKEGRPIAIKIFLTWTAEFKRGRLKYILGDPRFNGIDTSTVKLISTWASKEYKNLKKAYNAGVYVPKPIDHYRNIIVMEFIGMDSTPAPTLKEYKRLRGVTQYMLLQVLRQVKILYDYAELVHADLSEYNIFYYKRKPILFDFGQAVVKNHPNADEFLARDILNILDFFREAGVETPNYEDILEFILRG
ncbi:TPA: serine protein kinase RIO [Candidatus Geothermarchaeota archaeon]|nr:serine protein kinase RIO [Candidatus Geothermarchaeota archaeon]HIQ13299.1 serine protein kinase RIO [Thermoprotei archaeon]